MSMGHTPGAIRRRRSGAGGNQYRGHALGAVALPEKGTPTWLKETSSISMPEPGLLTADFFVFASLSSSSLSLSPNLHSGWPER